MSAFSFGFGSPGLPGLPQTGGIAGSQGPSVPSPSASVPSSDAPWWQQLFPFLQLGAQTYLADQAITSPRPSTVTYAPNGMLVAGAGGGAAAVLPGAVSSIPGWLWIVVVVVVLLVVLRR